MEEITCYRTDDGIVFESEKEAAKHEALIWARKEITSLLVKDDILEKHAADAADVLAKNIQFLKVVINGYENICHVMD